jgi:hypothetical protein
MLLDTGVDAGGGGGSSDPCATSQLGGTAHTQRETQWPPSLSGGYQGTAPHLYIAGIYLSGIQRVT